MQSKYELKKNYILVLRILRTYTTFSPVTTGGGLLRKPMNQPLNGVAEIP